MFTHLFKQLSCKEEICFNIEYANDLSDQDKLILKWILGHPTETTQLKLYYEVGPKLCWTTPWSSTVQSILTSLHLNTSITRIEASTRFPIKVIYNKNTHTVYEKPLLCFTNEPQEYDNSCVEIPLNQIECLNLQFEFGWDEYDMQYYKKIFNSRQPKLIELFHLAKSSNEHGRHWFFNGNLVIDGIEVEYLLLTLLKLPFKKNKGKTILAFCNGSSIREGANNNHLTLTCNSGIFAGTCVSERQRSGLTLGKGGSLLMAGMAGYYVGNIEFTEFIKDDQKYEVSSADILLQASDKLSEYANIVGEPLIQGFTRSFGIGKTSWTKPLFFSGGVGQICHENLYKNTPNEDTMIVKLGGPAYRISKDSDKREDPLMNQKVYRVIAHCADLLEENPIFDISNQNVNGNCRSLQELVKNTGANIELSQLNIGDDSMTPLELWISEYQESVAVLIEPDNIDKFITICERENCPYAIIGNITNSNRMVVTYKGDVVIDLPLGEELRKKEYFLFSEKKELTPLVLPADSLTDMLSRILQLSSVGSKRYLVTKVDRSVGGLVAQQQCVGPLQIPVANCAVIAQGFNEKTGIVTAIGEKPLLSLISPAKMARMAVAEALTNLMWAETDGLHNVKCAVTCMWPQKNADLVLACKSLSDFCLDVGIVIESVKDSLSTNAPGSLIVSCYTFCPDIRKTITPQLSSNGESIYLIFLDARYRMGGSALCQTYNQIGNNCPDVDSVSLRKLFIYVQSLVKNKKIIAGHDRSDGGLITTILEMCFAGNCGARLDLGCINEHSHLFHEGVGVVLQTKESLTNFPTGIFVQKLGYSTKEKVINIFANGRQVLNGSISVLQGFWERTSSRMQTKQIGEKLAHEELDLILAGNNPQYHITYPLTFTKQQEQKTILVGILRTEGTSGHKEAAAAFEHVGFQTIDIHVNDLISNPSILMRCRGLVFPGGFSFADILGAGRGFAAPLKFHAQIKSSLQLFFRRKNTFSLGIGNGFQLMCHLGIFKRVKLVKNNSGKFESRLVSVKIEKSNCIFFKNMEDSVLPVIVAHAEGKAIITHKTDKEPFTLMYVLGKDPTTIYPASPNGSAIAGICTENGRHLGIMPHPERCFLDWQLPYNPDKWEVSPWVKMFQNAFEWCYV